MDRSHVTALKTWPRVALGAIALRCHELLEPWIESRAVAHVNSRQFSQMCWKPLQFCGDSRLPLLAVERQSGHGSEEERDSDSGTFSTTIQATTLFRMPSFLHRCWLVGLCFAYAIVPQTYDPWGSTQRYLKKHGTHTLKRGKKWPFCCK